MNCWAVAEATGVPHVGLCHSVFGTARMLASHVGLPIDDLSYLVAGVNHMAFFLKLAYRGQDIYPLLLRVLEDPERNFERVRYEMMRRTGYFVTESSEHQSEYLPYFIHHGAEVIEKFDIPIDEYLRRCTAITATWKDTDAQLIGEDGDIDVKPQSHEYGSYIIHSRETNTPRTVNGNVPNDGLIDNLERGCCVEVPCLVDGTGLLPVKIGSLPQQLAALCTTSVNVQRLTVDAALSGKREHIYHAVMLDPHTSATLTLDRIWAMCDELIEAHQADGLLGEFAPVVRNTGRSHAGLGDRLIARAQPRGVRLDEAGNQFSLEVRVENPGLEAAEIDLALASADDGVTLAQDGVTLTVAAGGEETVVVAATVKRAIEEPVRSDLWTSDPRVLAIAATLLPRRRLDVDAEGTARFEIELSGFSCAEGTPRREGDGLRIKLRVKDSDPRLRPETPWQGSCVELFFRDESRPAITQLFVVPGEGAEARLLGPGLQPVPGGEIAVERSPVDYQIDALVPCREAGLV